MKQIALIVLVIASLLQIAPNAYASERGCKRSCAFDIRFDVRDKRVIKRTGTIAADANIVTRVWINGRECEPIDKGMMVTYITDGVVVEIRARKQAAPAMVRAASTQNARVRVVIESA